MMKIWLNSASSNQLRNVILSMDPSSRKRILSLQVLQLSSTLFEIFAIGIIGIIGLVSISGTGNKIQSDKVDFALKLLRINEFSLQGQVLALSVIFILILLAKTILVMVTSQRILRVLARETTRISNTLFGYVLNTSAKKIDLESKNTLNYVVNDAVDRTFLSLVANLSNLISDFFMLVIIFGLMMVVDLKTTLIAGIYFSIFGWFVLKRQQRVAQESGRTATNLKLGIADKTFEAFRLKRELNLRGAIPNYIFELSKSKLKLNSVNARIIFLPVETRYFMEGSIILGAVLVCGMQFFLRDAAHAFGGIAIFLAAATRAVPAILRLQNEVVTIKAVQQAVSRTLDLIPLAVDFASKPKVSALLNPEQLAFDIKFDLVTFRYDDEGPDIFANLDVRIEENDYVAITGESGGGKSTFIDLLLGEVVPTRGRVLIGNQPSVQVCRNSGGRIAIVPQKVQLINGTVYQNISLTDTQSAEEIRKIENLLREVNLFSDLKSLPNGLLTVLGDQGSMTSVGQQQRIGIARALYSNPRILILDEATSALDEANEKTIVDIINALRGTLTILTITHRPPFVVSADYELRVSGRTILEIRNPIGY